MTGAKYAYLSFNNLGLNSSNVRKFELPLLPVEDNVEPPPGLSTSSAESRIYTKETV